jgi:predicted CXXCH cytochrome family protein
MMRRACSEIRLIYVSLLAGLVVSGAAQAKISGTPHDLGGDICVGCHTPRATAPPELPLWNRRAPAKASFTMYDSPAMAAATGGQPHGVSLVCLACHDGVTSHNALLKNSGTVAARDFARNPFAVGEHGPFGRHPISVTYNPDLFRDFNAVRARTVGGLPLYRSPDAEADLDLVECASCHNPHDMTYGRYLRMDNARSALCLTCHIR